MRIGFLQIPHLPIQTARLRHPALRDRPLIIGGSPESHRGLVIDASPDCRAAGVARGMAIREALELAPEASFIPWNPHADADILGRALDLLERFSDVVEEVVGDGAWFVPAVPNGPPADERRVGAAIVDGLAATLGLDARVGLGSGKFVARVAAGRATAGSIEIVAADESAAYLAPLSIALLPLLPNALERLKLLGLTTIGEFARLPLETLPRRFGREALATARIARGDDPGPIVPRRRPPTLAARRVFEPPIEDRSILLGAARDALDQLVRQLQLNRQAFRALEIIAGLEDGRITERHADLREPTNDLRHCGPLLQELVEALTFDQSVASITVRLGTIDREPVGQGELFDKEVFDGTRARRRERVVATLTEISRRYRGRLRHLAPGDDPGSLLDDRRLTLLPGWATDPKDALSAKQASAADALGVAEPATRFRPISLVGDRNRMYLREAGGERDEIVALHARWEANDWWPDATHRTYYRIRTGRGLIVTLARDHERKRWLLIESFD